MKTQQPHPTLLSFDILRIAAMTLVALQHLLSTLNKNGPSLFRTLDLGQMGVACFCAISGYFSLHASSSGNIQWLTRRLQRVFIPYWISLLAIFAANAFTHYKPVSTGLVISEFAGTGLFTHADSLIGVHVWFISLILLCYAMALCLRFSRRCFPALFIIAFALVGWNPLISSHLISFLCGCLLAEKSGSASRRWVAIGISLGCIAAIFILNLQYAYPLIATSLILLCASSSSVSSHWLGVASNATYEFFLVHGPIYLGLALYAHWGLFANMIFGTTIAIFATIVLCKIENAVLVIVAMFYRYYAVDFNGGLSVGPVPTSGEETRSNE
jgi:hypothetical protein